jgi:hypothetical protein
MRAVIELLFITIGMTFMFLPVFIWIWNDHYTVEYVLRNYYHCYIIGLGLIFIGGDLGDNG